MRQFFSFVRKEFRHILRDPRTMLILLGMPVVQILLFGFAISTEVKNTGVAVLDPSADHVTRRVVEQFDASSYFDVVREVKSLEEIDELFRRGDISLAIVFSPRFASEAGHSREARVQLIADGCEPNQAQMVVGYAQNVLAHAFATSPLQNSTTPQLNNSTPPRLQVTVRQLYNPQTKSAYNFVPGVMGMILLLICAMMTSVSIVREKETGTMEVLLASPMPTMGIVVAKMVPYFVLSCVNLATILLLSHFVLDVPVRGSLLLLLTLSLLYIALALSLGLLVSNMVRTQMAAVLISGMALIVPTVVLSGLMFPIESMPDVLQWLSAIVPARWFIAAVRKVMIQGVTLEQVTTEVAVLATMTALLLFASIKRFKVRLQ